LGGVTEVNWQILLGALFTAAGVLLTSWGAWVRGKENEAASSTERKAEMQELSTKVDALLARPADEVPAAEVKAIEDEYREIARNFAKSQDDTAAEFRLRLLEAEQQSIAVERRWSPVYKKFLEAVRKLAAAYSDELKVPILVEFPELPDRFVSIDQRDQWKGKVTFQDGTEWEVSLRRSPTDRIPTLWVDSGDDSFYMGAFADEFDTVRFGALGSFDLHLKGRIPQAIPVEDAPKEIPGIARRLFEIQMTLPSSPTTESKGEKN
jgi:hypothetical protein